MADGGDGGPPPEVIGGVAVERVFGSVEVESGEVLREETLEPQEYLKLRRTFLSHVLSITSSPREVTRQGCW